MSLDHPPRLPQPYTSLPQPCTIPHALCDTLYLAMLLLGC